MELAINLDQLAPHATTQLPFTFEVGSRTAAITLRVLRTAFMVATLLYSNISRPHTAVKTPFRLNSLHKVSKCLETHFAEAWEQTRLVAEKSRGLSFIEQAFKKGGCCTHRVRSPLQKSRISFNHCQCTLVPSKLRQHLYCIPAADCAWG